MSCDVFKKASNDCLLKWGKGELTHLDAGSHQDISIAIKKTVGDQIYVLWWNDKADKKGLYLPAIGQK